jgi:hypothetical protein
MKPQQTHLYKCMKFNNSDFKYSLQGTANNLILECVEYVCRKWQRMILNVHAKYDRLDLLISNKNKCVVQFHLYALATRPLIW